MDDLHSSELYKDRKLVQAINRYRWVESDKVGFDIGFEQAAEEWLVNFSQNWLADYLNKRRQHIARFN